MIGLQSGYGQTTLTPEGTLVMSWQAEVEFTLETAPSAVGPGWSAVSGVTGNTATVTIVAAPAYFRLRR